MCACMCVCVGVYKQYLYVDGTCYSSSNINPTDGDNKKEPVEFSSTSTNSHHLEGSEPPPMDPHVASPTGQDRLDMSVTHESSAIPESDTEHRHQIPTTMTAQQPAGATSNSIQHQLQPPSLPTTLSGIDSLQATSYQLPSLPTYSSQTSQDPSYPVPSQSSHIPTCQVSVYRPSSVTVCSSQSNHEATVMYEDSVVQEAAALLASLSDTILSPPRPMQARPQVPSELQQQPVGSDPAEVCMSKYHQLFDH